MARTRRRSTGPRLQVNLESPQLNNGSAVLVAGASARRWLRHYLLALPAIAGESISLRFSPELTAYRGTLLSRAGARGRPVHAASFLQTRRIVLEEQLTSRPSELRLILTHEILHFVWRRLGNPNRLNYSLLLAEEFAKRARFELGESATVAKEGLMDCDRVGHSPGWRNYVCESFCDTGAWLWSGVDSCCHFQLAHRWRERRAIWFRGLPWLRA